MGAELNPIEQVVKSPAWDALVRWAVAELFLAAPFLAWGPLGPVVAYVVTRLADKLFDGLHLFYDLKTIAIIHEVDQGKYDRASVTLVVIARDKGVDSKEFKEARGNAKLALAQFVRFRI